MLCSQVPIRTSADKTDMTSILQYYTPLGSHPREQPTDIYIKRREPFTGEVKIVPEMAYFRGHHVHPVPVHTLLEDDWRAYRTYAYVNARMARLERLLGSYQEQQSSLVTYCSIQGCPCNTHHHRYACQFCSLPRVPCTLPKTVFTGPFQKVMPIDKSGKLKRKVGWQYRKLRQFQPSSRLSGALGECPLIVDNRRNTSNADNAVPMTVKELSQLPWADMDKMEPDLLKEMLGRMRESIV